MPKLTWAPFFHLYQPPHWDAVMIEKIARESYRPLLQLLKDHPTVKCSVNVTGSLTEQLFHLGMVDILHDLRTLASLGQIEFLGTAMYHPILAKLPDHEIVRQIELNVHMNRRVFGKAYDPRGFWIPELCYSTRVATIIRDFGFHWIVLDPICLTAPLPSTPTRAMITGVGLDVLFRNRAASDAFFSPAMKGAKDFSDILAANHDAARYPLVTAMDGENIGHHRPELVAIFREILETSNATFVTGSECIRAFQRVEEIDVRAGSWASRPEHVDRGVPYILWDDPENPIHVRQWKLLHFVETTVETLHDDPQYEKSRTALDECMMSDQFWWASAKPWWSADVVKTLTRRLVAVIENLSTAAPVISRTAHTLESEIYTLVGTWDTNGKAASIRSRYLSTDSTPRFMSGHAIH
ncbi:MAG: polysaccharide deacetylase family protein [Candidatus Kerfeldbacteria bacterium]|nr:polysaccharide deacetylase family protein [Candidatus Kerfeldbacteria bacterium]